MASELRVNTLKDAAGNNSIATSFVAGGSAKAWINFNGTGTVAIVDSFNIASITDNATGDYTNTLTSAMVNDDYLYGGAASPSVSGDYARIYTPRGDGTTSDASTTAYRGECHQSWTANAEDNPAVFSLVHGDLA